MIGGIDEPTSMYERTVSMRCMREKQRLVVRVPIEKSQFGISYVAISNPLWNNGKLEGVVSVAMSDKFYGVSSVDSYDLSDFYSILN
ncbi:Methyl-accepting chemotaxis (MCP) signaling domain protein (fragment) [Candidatus Desulfosporosinus infrequens]|uniref:Methyl-accepting chemotaxis (MCP) signaling domain protein n=1 Tax=Candidatus Desulfosporosinus infrequens TaxID=2043169 RepID=A0A2U3LJN4_9FIRM